MRRGREEGVGVTGEKKMQQRDSVGKKAVI